MTQNLDYRIVDRPRDYWLVYKVTNKKTGAQNEQRFEFIISAVNGWIVLDEDVAGNGDIADHPRQRHRGRRKWTGSEELFFRE